jgi:acetylornithine deacetylase/succinyl-diaminopimelate desuccinylase-like protein
MNAKTAQDFVDAVWSDSIVPSLVEYIRIPNRSPAFDKDWQANGHMERAVELIAGWCREQPVEGLVLEVVRLPGRTPLLYMEVPGTVDDTVVLYGHLDKQPEMTGWEPGLDPWEPVLREDRLYGRGGADDGYAAYASLTAIRAVQQQGLPHARMVILIEGCEESGSYDLPYYVDHLADRIGTPSLVVCLDSGCGNYDQLWATTSLRGLVSGNLRIDVLVEGVHSGDASGIVPSSFRVLRHLLDRIDDPRSGRVIPEAFHCEIPAQRRSQAEVCARVLSTQVYGKFPWAEGARPVSDDLTELVLNRTWRPALSITGADGLPPLESAGNVLRPFTSARISLRLPPLVDAKKAGVALKQILETDPPCGTKVRFTGDQAASGWNAPALAPWLEKAVDEASRTFFGREAVYMGEGGTIPFMGMLGEKFPDAQFLITGVLGPGSNAHGPNEFLHLPMARRLTACVARILSEHARRGRP